MSTRLITGIIALCIGTSAAVLSSMFMIMMIGEINRKRQEENLVSYFGFTFPKMLMIFREYRRSYPKGKLYIYTLSAYAVAFAALVCVAICLRIIG